MLGMIFPMIIATIGYFLASTGSNTQIKAFTAIGGILIFVAAIWFLCNAGYNIGYMLA